MHTIQMHNVNTFIPTYIHASTHASDANFMKIQNQIEKILSTIEENETIKKKRKEKIVYYFVYTRFD